MPTRQIRMRARQGSCLALSMFSRPPDTAGAKIHSHSTTRPQIISATIQHHGPLPTAEYLREINEFIPNGAERVHLRRQRNHRQWMRGKHTQVSLQNEPRQELDYHTLTDCLTFGVQSNAALWMRTLEYHE